MDLSIILTSTLMAISGLSTGIFYIYIYRMDDFSDFAEATVESRNPFFNVDMQIWIEKTEQDIFAENMNFWACCTSIVLFVFFNMLIFLPAVYKHHHDVASLSQDYVPDGVQKRVRDTRSVKHVREMFDRFDPPSFLLHTIDPPQVWNRKSLGKYSLGRIQGLK